MIINIGGLRPCCYHSCANIIEKRRKIVKQNDVKPYDDKKYALYVEHTNDNFEPENITWFKNFDKNFNYLNRKNGRRFKG